MLSVRLDRFDHQVESTGAVDLACHAVGPIRHEAEAFGEVEQSVYTLSVAVQQSEHRARTIFRPREQKQMIGAEVEHGVVKTEGAGAEAPAASAAPLWG